MADEPEPRVWGELGAEGLSERRRDELRTKSERGDLIYLAMLIPAGFLLIVGSLIWMLLADFGRISTSLGIAQIILGFFAWIGAGKIALGRR